MKTDVEGIVIDDDTGTCQVDTEVSSVTNPVRFREEGIQVAPINFDESESRRLSDENHLLVPIEKVRTFLVADDAIGKVFTSEGFFLGSHGKLAVSRCHFPKKGIIVPMNGKGACCQVLKKRRVEKVARAASVRGNVMWLKKHEKRVCFDDCVKNCRSKLAVKVAK